MLVKRLTPVLAAIVVLLQATTPLRGQTITRGLEMELVYTADVVANLSGGIERGARFIDNLDVALAVNGDDVGWKGGGILIYGIGNQGGNITALVGDAQVVNNIEAPANWRLFEAWIEQALGKRLSILAGLYDLNSEFDVNHTGVIFINSSHGTGAELSQSGLNGPSIFPVTSMGIRGRVAVSNALEIRVAVLDGVPGDPAEPRGTHVIFGEDDGLLLAAEIEMQLDSGRHPRRRNVPRRMVDPISTRARLVAGGWSYTNEQSAIVDPLQTARSRGAYFLGEWRPYKEPQDHSQGLSTFLRAGVATARANRFSSYVGAGAVYTGLLDGRDGDKIGAAVAVAVNGDPYMTTHSPSPASGELTRTETNVEWTYSAALASWLNAQIDLQYVVNPNTRRDIPNAVVPTLRVVLAP